MVEKQKYFQKHFPRYQGDFFLVEQAQMEETNLKHHTLQKCKVKAVDELKIFTTKLRSRVVKGIKSTKEWYTINGGFCTMCSKIVPIRKHIGTPRDQLKRRVPTRKQIGT
jgi:hypothetical protein